ncbi:MAG: redoxin domain-containing protein [Bryobacteraceae bacterium]
MTPRLHLLLCAALALAPAVAQVAPPAKPAPAREGPDANQPAADARLEQELRDSGGSPADITAVLEKHLQVHPDCPKQKEIVRLLAQLAVESKDKRRELKYGPEAIESGNHDLRLLTFVTRELLNQDDAESRQRALKFSALLVPGLREELKKQLASKAYAPGQGRRLDETEFTLKEALVYQSRALDRLGRDEEALPPAVEAWELQPSLDAALERSLVLERLGRYSDALDAAAEAFIVEDERADRGERQRARERMAELAAKARIDDPSSRVLPAWDRVLPLIEARRLRLRNFDPNSVASSPLDFTLTRLDGGQLALNTLKGKVLVLDFWATWCGPCRGQHPLYEQIRERFKDNPNVIFLDIATDEDRSLVKPFLERQKWSKEVLYDDGLGGYFRVNSIPTTIVLSRRGEVHSRMRGYEPERFVDQLSERIKAALEQN